MLSRSSMPRYCKIDSSTSEEIWSTEIGLVRQRLDRTTAGERHCFEGNGAFSSPCGKNWPRAQNGLTVVETARLRFQRWEGFWERIHVIVSVAVLRMGATWTLGGSDKLRARALGISLETSIMIGSSQERRGGGGSR